MQARYYDPVIGRFYSNDPVATNGQLSHGERVHGFNRCKYANNNPYKFVDPNGQEGVNIGVSGKLVGEGGQQLFP